MENERRKMKIKKEHYKELKTMIKDVLKRDNTSVGKILAHYEKHNIGNNPKIRVMADIVHTCPKGTKFICKELYPYIDDTHIQTALQSILKELI